MILLALLAVGFSGAALARAGFPSNGRDLPLRFAAGLALGAGTWSSADSAALLLFGPRALWIADALLAAVAAALCLRKQRIAAEEPVSARAPPWLRALFVVACLVCAAAFVEHTWRFPDGGWDAWMVWNLRARFFFRGGEGFRAAFSPDMLFFAHQDYPFLVPGAVARGFALVGSENPLVPELLAALFGALALALLTLCAARMRGERWGLFAGLALLTLPCFPIFASNQQSDVPLAVYLLLAAALVEWNALPLAGFCAGLGAWTKNEGAMMLAFFVLALLWRTRDWRAAARFLLGALPLLALLAFYKLRIAPPTDLAALSTRETLLSNAVDVRRWGELLVLMLRRIVYFQDFGLWLVAEVALLWSLRKRRPGPVGTALLLSALAFLPIYVLQPHPLQWIFRTSADRLVMQLWPAAILATLTARVPARTTAHT